MSAPLNDIAARVRVPAGQIGILITETTRMGPDRMCVAGIRSDNGSTVRLHNHSEHNWSKTLWPDLFEPGAVVAAPIHASQEQGTLPHAREDLRLSQQPSRIGKATEQEFYQACFERASPSIDIGFQNRLIDKKFALEGTDCPSLFGLRVPANLVTPFQKQRYQKPGNDLRCWIGGGGFPWNFKVTAIDAFSDERQRYWLQRLPAIGNVEIVLRIGLARRLMDGDQAKCYAQINGFILPPTP